MTSRLTYYILIVIIWKHLGQSDITDNYELCVSIVTLVSSLDYAPDHEISKLNHYVRYLQWSSQFGMLLRLFIYLSSYNALYSGYIIKSKWRVKSFPRCMAHRAAPVPIAITLGHR